MEDQDNQRDQRFNDIYKYKPSSKFESPCVAQKLTSQEPQSNNWESTNIKMLAYKNRILKHLNFENQIYI